MRSCYKARASAFAEGGRLTKWCRLGSKLRRAPRIDQCRAPATSSIASIIVATITIAANATAGAAPYLGLDAGDVIAGPLVLVSESNRVLRPTRSTKSSGLKAFRRMVKKFPVLVDCEPGGWPRRRSFKSTIQRVVVGAVALISSSSFPDLHRSARATSTADQFEI